MDIKEKKFCFNDWDYLGYERVSILTGQQILDRFWNYWSGEMVKKYGVGHELITEKNCIEDWCTINWAWDKKE